MTNMKPGKFRIFEIIYFVLVLTYGAYGLFIGTGLERLDDQIAVRFVRRGV